MMSSVSEQAVQGAPADKAQPTGTIAILSTFFGVGICIGINAILSWWWPPEAFVQRALYAVISGPWIFLGPFIATAAARRRVLRAMARRMFVAGPWVILAGMAMVHLGTARGEGEALRGFHDENRDALRGGLIPAIGALSADPVAQLPAMRMKLYALKAYLYEQDIIAEPGLANPLHVLAWDIDAFIDGNEAVENHKLRIAPSGPEFVPLYIPLDCGVRGCGDDGTSMMLDRLQLTVNGEVISITTGGDEAPHQATLLPERAGFGRENLRWLKVTLPDDKPEALVTWSVTEQTSAPFTVLSVDLWRFVRASRTPADAINVRLSFSRPLRGGATWGLHDLTSLWDDTTPLLRIDDATFQGNPPGPGAMAEIKCADARARACYQGTWRDAKVPPFLAFDQTLGEDELVAQRGTALAGLRARVEAILAGETKGAQPDVFLYCETCTGHDAIFRDLARSAAVTPPRVRLLVGSGTPDSVVSEIFTEFRNSSTPLEVRRVVAGRPAPMKEFGIVAPTPQDWAFVSVVVDPSTGVALLLQGEGAQEARSRFDRFWNEADSGLAKN